MRPLYLGARLYQLSFVDLEIDVGRKPPEYLGEGHDLARCIRKQHGNQYAASRPSGAFQDRQAEPGESFSNWRRRPVNDQGLVAENRIFSRFPATLSDERKRIHARRRRFPEELTPVFSRKGAVTRGDSEAAV